VQRAVPLNLCAGMRPLRAHLTSVRGDTRRYNAASRAFIQGELGTMSNILSGDANAYTLPTMQEKRERWMELAALAATEQDPEKLTELVHEIDRLLAEKMDRLRGVHPPSKPAE
jgi:hypothetical protein